MARPEGIRRLKTHANPTDTAWLTDTDTCAYLPGRRHTHTARGHARHRIPSVENVMDKLGARPIISSYKIVNQLSEFVPGSREWLYQELTAWLDRGVTEGDSSGRMFLLLAGAGMGKSVFSAVVSWQPYIHACAVANDKHMHVPTRKACMSLKSDHPGYCHHPRPPHTV